MCAHIILLTRRQAWVCLPASWLCFVASLYDATVWLFVTGEASEECANLRCHSCNFPILWRAKESDGNLVKNGEVPFKPMCAYALFGNCVNLMRYTGSRREKECPPRNGTFLEGIVEVTRLYRESREEEEAGEVGPANRDFAHMFRTPDHIGSMIERGYLLSLTWLHIRHGKREQKPVEPKIMDFAKTMEQLLEDENEKYKGKPPPPKTATQSKG